MTKKEALKALEKRRETAPEQIDNASLYAGSSMTFYCKVCGHVSEVLPETFICPPKKFCDACQHMKNQGWLD